MGVVFPSSNQLWMIHDDAMKGDSPELGRVEQLVGGHAVSLSQLGVMLVLDLQQGLALYSGCRKVRRLLSMLRG